MMIDADLFAIVAPAFAAGVMIALTHAPLGLEVLKRGIIFMDLAIAQCAGLGLVVISVLLHEEAHPLLQQGVALAFALGGALFFRWVEKVLPEQQEAVIGSTFVGVASLSMLLLTNHPHGGEEIQHLLSGQILFVTWADVLHHLPVYALVLACWFAYPKARQGFMFYALFALAITSSVQLVGVYVVFASLVLPALAVSRLQHHQTIWQTLGAWACGLTSVTLGLATATFFDLPAGLVVVLSYLTVTAFVLAIMPSTPSARRSGR